MSKSPDPQSVHLPVEVVSLRRSLFLATGSGITLAGLWLMWNILGHNGMLPTEWVLIALFTPLFLQLAFGFSIAFWGFLTLLSGGERHDILRTLPAPSERLPEPGTLAVVMPVYNEETGRVFQGIENMLVSLEATGRGRSIDFFVLSDSNIPDCWVEEERAWVDLCARLKVFGRLFYRKRRVSLHGKSGNIADFCRRWGRRYHYLLILDADSIMTGETLANLRDLMDVNPRAGIIQTTPQLVLGRSAMQRLGQFATRLLGPMFAAGSGFWHLDGGNYWGHNAIIRLRPFMEHCVLPELPVRRAHDRHIMSHDTVEAALMQQAGWQVWIAPLDEGSYEESPPNLTESLKRDRRWCQGNLQHYWFLFAPGTRFNNRIHMFFGLMAFLTSPMLALFIVLSSVDYFWKERHATLSAQLLDPMWSTAPNATVPLFLLTLTLLFLPKLFALILAFRNPLRFGGLIPLLGGSILELMSGILLAPVLLYFYSRFVIQAMFGIRVSWKTQNRSDSAIRFGEAVRVYLEPTLAGVICTIAALIYVPALVPWLSPVLTGLLLSIPLAMMLSSEKIGGWLRQRGIFIIPEERVIPPEFLDLDDDADAVIPRDGIPREHRGLTRVTLDPYVNATHVAMLRRARDRSRLKQDYLDALRERLLKEGPNALSRRDLMALLWDAEALNRLHRSVWRTAEEALHPWWRYAMHHYNEAGASLARGRK